MNCVSTEFRRGILFVRVKGRIDSNECLKCVNDIVLDFGIKYVVLNIDNVHDLSVCDIKSIDNYNRDMLRKKRILYLCDCNRYRDRVFEFIPKICNETQAFSLI